MDRAIFGPRSYWRGDDYPIDWTDNPLPIRFSNVRVHWPSLVEALEEAGHNAVTEAPLAQVPETDGETPSGIRTTRAAEAEEACGRYISSLTERPANKDAAFEEAVNAAGPLSGKAFDRQWTLHAPADWKHAGRRKKPQ